MSATNEDFESVFTESTEIESVASSGVDPSNLGAGLKKKRKYNKSENNNTKPKIDAPFVLNCYVHEHYSVMKEGYKYKRCEEPKPIYGIAFNPYYKTNYYFATVSDCRCTFYQITASGSLDLVHCYIDCNHQESFYCCAWLYDRVKKQHLVAAAGENGIIRVILPSAGDQYCTLVGHGSSINDMCTHPTDSNLLLSASKDHTLRLWNVRNQLCIAIFGGYNGHSAQVISCDFDVNGEKILSSGMDHTVRIWYILQNPQLDSAINASNNFFDKKDEKPFQTIKIHQADFLMKDIHTNYVDSALFFGDLIVSKSCENRISLWKPGDLTTLEFAQDETNVTKLRDYVLPNSSIWYIRIAIDFQFKWLAAGNMGGQIYIWSLLSNLSTTAAVLKHPKCKSCVRQLAFSPDGKVLIAVCDDGTIWRWDACEF